MKRLLLLVMLFAAACAHPDRKSRPPKPISKTLLADIPIKRVITVCIANDVAAPVKPRVIEKLFSMVSADYHANVGVVFRALPTVEFDGDLESYPIDQGFYLRKICPANAEIRMVFTNQRLMSADQSDARGRDPAAESAADSHTYFGFLQIYNVEERMKVRDESGNVAPFTTLRHEIGHIFGLEHTPDKKSFMYTPSALSEGLWTDDVVDFIVEHRDRRWFPKI